MHKLWVSLFVLTSLAATATAEVSLEAPRTVVAGAQVEVIFSGGGSGRDFITIVPTDKPEGQYDAYQYARKTSVDLRAPEDAGEYEIRYVSAERPFTTLAKLPLTITPATATVQVPAAVAAGTSFEVPWTGPDNRQDYISIRLPGSERKALTYRYTKSGSPAKLTAPDKPGTYEVAYQTGGGYRTLAVSTISVGNVEAAVTAPATVQAGETFDVSWSGPDNARDYVSLSDVDGDPKRSRHYAYTKEGSPVALRAPDAPGVYEIRYQTGQTSKVLATARIAVADVSATLHGPVEVQGGTKFDVTWNGPDHAGDYVILANPDEERGGAKGSGWAYTRHGSPAGLRAPLEPGVYELRYQTGQSARILARQKITVTPPATEPGHLSVSLADGAGAAFADGDAVELILDASGSMLKRQDGKLRIEIAREVLMGLTGEAIPAGTPFALRVFGHKEADSCRSDLEIPLGPLDVAAADATIRAVQAMNLAKTPIARSLELAGSDLGAVTGERIVVLITDGEETCDGDPAAAIERLKKSGIDVRVDIVGFAIDDEQLKAQFRYWAELGGGRYHDAAGTGELGAMMNRALGAPYAVIDSNGDVVATGNVGDDGVDLPAGDYTVQTRTQPPLSGAATVVAGKRAGASLR